MPQSADQFSGIFVCYRRDDSIGHAGRLYDRLVAHFGDEKVFMDVDRIQPGEDFVRVIEDAVGSCEVLLAVIGRNWLMSRDEAGRRLYNPNDFVRLEIAAALARDVCVIPVLVQGARMPRPQDLPEDLALLSRRNALELSDLRWKHDVDRLIVLIKEPVCRQPEAQYARAQAGARRNASPAGGATQSGRQAGRAAGKPRDMTNHIGMEFVWVPPGSFMMGSENLNKNEKPAHRVTLGEGFYMSRYEVTQAQWRAVFGNDPSDFKGDNLPVENVSWDDAVAFIAQLNARGDKYTYRLPSEAEWEYAARAGTTDDYAGYPEAMAWYAKNSGGKTHPVGGKLPNPFGLFDMFGNVFEWCQDWYHDNYVGAPTDGSAWLIGGKYSWLGGGKYRVARGGAFFYDSKRCRSADRSRFTQSTRMGTIGFRVVATTRQ